MFASIEQAFNFWLGVWSLSVGPHEAFYTFVTFKNTR